MIMGARVSLAVPLGGASLSAAFTTDAFIAAFTQREESPIARRVGRAATWIGR
jgi:hypothetical protein